MTLGRWFRTLAVSGALVSFAACGGGAPSAPTPLSHASAPTTTTATRLSITIPYASSSTVGGKLHPAYVSPATKSVVINVTPQGSGTSVSGYPQTVNLTPTSAGCTASLSSTQCSLALAFAPGNYNATLTTYDQTGGVGNVLSAAQSVPFTVNSGAVNSIALALGGIPSTVQFVPVSVTLTGSVNLGFTLALNAAATMQVFALDADGNVIVGAGAPTISVASSNSVQLSVTGPTTAVPNTLTLTSVGQAALITLTATVTPTASSGASVVTASAVVAPPLSVLPLHLYVLSNPGLKPFDQNGNALSLTGSFQGLGNPHGITYDSANGFLYIADYFGSTITAYDTNGNKKTLSGTFPNLNGPEGITYDPANGFLYAANITNSTVTAYDQNGNQQTLSGTFPSLGEPYDVAYDPGNGFLYVTNFGSGTITVYDQNGNKQTLSGTFPNLSLPSGIAYDSANGFLYVVNDTPKVTVYDQNGNQRILGGSSFPSLLVPRSIVYDPVNGFFYVANENNATVTAYDQNGNQQTLSGSFANLINPYGLALAP